MAGDPVNETFARWLDRTMANAGMSGTDLSAASGIDEGSISRWRRGHARPGVQSCERLANALHVDPRQLAVTAGRLSHAMAPVDSLPMPPGTAERERVREQIRHIRGLTDRTRQALLDAYDAAAAEEED